MSKKVIRLALSAMLLALSFQAQAQQAKKVPRIGYLVSRSGPGPNDRGFQQGLSELGYVEGQNIVIERRWAGGNPDRLPDLAADLVRLKVDVIFAGGAKGSSSNILTTSRLSGTSFKRENDEKIS
jgi:putative ABC transport system substrate-binding protein